MVFKLLILIAALELAFPADLCHHRVCDTKKSSKSFMRDIPRPPSAPVPPPIPPGSLPPRPPAGVPHPPPSPIPEPTEPSGLPTPPEQPDDKAKRSAREIYEIECALCHGKKGEGTERGYALRNPYRPYATEVTRMGRNGNPEFPIPMPAYPESVVSDDELAEIWSFLDSIGKQELEMDGRQLYVSFCLNCHGSDGKGGVTLQNVLSSESNGPSLNTLKNWIRWGRRDGDYLNRYGYMPRWNRWELSDVSVEKIRKYLQSLKGEAGLNEIKS